MWLAERTPTTILSADSRQVYRGFDIGTAKPTVAERARVPHRGIDVVDPTERYSAAAWAASADGWIDDARSAGRAPLVVGGTGLYLRALFEGLFEEPPLDATSARATRGRARPAECRRVASLGAFARSGTRAPWPHAASARRSRSHCSPAERLSDLHREPVAPWTLAGALSSGGSRSGVGRPHCGADRPHARPRMARRGATTDGDGSGGRAGVELDGIRRRSATRVRRPGRDQRRVREFSSPRGNTRSGSAPGFAISFRLPREARDAARPARSRLARASPSVGTADRSDA